MQLKSERFDSIEAFPTTSMQCGDGVAGHAGNDVFHDLRVSSEKRENPKWKSPDMLKDDEL